MKNISTRTISFVALFVALEVVLNRFVSINTQILKIGFAFVPIAMCGIMYGPVLAAVTGAIADFTGAMLFGNGPYFPGFTITMALTGIVFGLFLYGENVGVPKFAAAIGINCIVMSLGLNSVWLNMLYGTPFDVLFFSRLFQCGVNIVTYIIILPILYKLGQKMKPVTASA